jgi:hypothetical protein
VSSSRRCHVVTVSFASPHASVQGNSAPTNSLNMLAPTRVRHFWGRQTLHRTSHTRSPRVNIDASPPSAQHLASSTLAKPSPTTKILTTEAGAGECFGPTSVQFLEVRDHDRKTLFPCAKCNHIRPNMVAREQHTVKHTRWQRLIPTMTSRHEAQW